MSKIRQVRRQKRLLMEVVARVAKCSVKHLWLWERWNIPPHREIAERIAQALDVSLTELDYTEPRISEE